MKDTLNIFFGYFINSISIVLVILLQKECIYIMKKLENLEKDKEENKNHLHSTT